MRIPPFDSSQRAGSNGGIPILLRPLDAELIGEMSSNRRFYHCVSSNNSASSGYRGMGIPPFEPAHRDESNGGIPILLRSLDVEIFGETSNGAVPKVIKTPI